jgi:hypothetical protein
MQTPEIRIYDETGILWQRDIDLTRDIMDLAVRKWEEYILSHYSLTIDLTIRDNLGPAAATTEVEYTVPLVNLRDKKLFTSVAAYKLAFGTDSNGDHPEATINITTFCSKPWTRAISATSIQYSSTN